MERDPTRILLFFAKVISTHTLTWSVTGLTAVKQEVRQISTHTLTWSVTGQLMRDYIKFGISTHTLTWSVTQPIARVNYGLNDFNSHAHVERDILLRGYLSSVSNFNSHAHVERDGATVEFTIVILNFNSHAHVERDARAFINPMFNGISTHTLTWSVTVKRSVGYLLNKFQLTRSRGA